MSVKHEVKAAVLKQESQSKIAAKAVLKGTPLTVDTK